MTKNKDQDNNVESPRASSFELGAILVQWDFPEYEKFERGILWYLGAIVVTLLLLVYAYFSENPLFAIIIILIGIIFFVSERRGPEYHTFAIAEDGIFAGDHFYPYNELRDFFIIYEPPEIKTLYIEPRNFFRPRLSIPLQDQDPLFIRELLLEVLPEDLEKEQEPGSDSWGRLLKF